MKKFLAIILILISAPHSAWAFADDCKSVPNKSDGSLQLIVVTSSDWDQKTAGLQRYERKNKSDPWLPVGDKIDVVMFGKNGMGWGKDFVKLAPQSDPRKKEGDGKSPAGIFSMGAKFGFAAPDKTNFSQRPNYRQLKDSTYCVDDQNSKYYNQIIDTNDPKITSNPPHNEKMRDQELYKFGAVINYESSRKLGTGSCIFMHIWKNSTSGTAGCVAMAEENIKEVLQWMKPQSKPAMALFTQPAYDQVKTCLKLPSLFLSPTQSSAGQQSR